MQPPRRTDVLRTKDWFPDPAFPFQITRTGPGHRYREHRHEFHEFFLLTAGKRAHTIDGKSRTLERGDVVMLSPRHRHAFVPVPDAPGAAWQVIFVPSLLGVDAAALRREKSFTELVFMLPFYAEDCRVFRLTGKTLLRAEVLLAELHAEFKDRPRGWQTAIRAKLTDLLIIVARAFEQETRQRPAASTGVSGTTAAILDSLAYIDTHFTGDLQLTDVAKRTAGTSAEYYSTIFHQLTGTTFSNYVAGLRVGRAKELLAATGKKTIEVCHESGFHDVSHFNRMFKKHTGVTPTAFRRKQRPA
jgi:AraC-like DNA-binding protein/mannose-6-phosphate isomerase-like protein (cupin superfamily)